MRSRAKRALRPAGARRPVGNGYAPVFGEFARRMRHARGKHLRKTAFQAAINAVASKRGVAFQREIWAESGFSCAARPSFLGG